MKTPTKQDARRLTHEQLTELRRRAILSIKGGESPEVVARVLGISRATIYGWIAMHRAGGMDALDAKKRGGRRPHLNGKQLQQIFDIITQKNPMQLKFTFALWTSKMVGEVIYKKFGINLGKSSVCRLLNQLGLTPQRPLWRAYQQNPEEVQKWFDVDYPKIKREAAKLGATIYFGDEAGIRSDHHFGTTWAEKGKTPIVSSTGARFGLNVISAVSAQGQLRFMTVEGSVKVKEFIEFIKRLLVGATEMIFLIVDGHPVHKSKAVRTFVDSIKDRFRLYFLPSYSPELNPDERVWNDLKNNALGRQVISDPKQMKKAVSSHLRLVQNSPERVRGYFNNETTKYAA